MVGQAVVVNTFNPNTQETEASRSQIRGQTDLQREFQDSPARATQRNSVSKKQKQNKRNTQKLPHGGRPEIYLD